MIRVETKETELRGIRTEVKKQVSQIQGEYTVDVHYCNHCSEDLTELLEDKDINYCPMCGLDLINNRIPSFVRAYDSVSTIKLTNN